MRENAISMRIGRVIVCGCLLTMSVLSGRTALGGSDTTFYVVRHAEQAGTPTDAPLTEQGMRRAEELREVLKDVSLSAVYATQTLRTFQTATPVAAEAGLDISTYDGSADQTAFWAKLLKHKHAGKSVLIVGHSTTVGNIVQLLGGTTVPPIDNAYDRLFVVTLRDGVATTEQRRYHVLEVGKAAFDLGLPSELKNISAIAAGPGNHVLVAGDDETNSLQVLVLQKDGRYQAQKPIALVSPESKEIDIEGITRHGTDSVFYVIGSHDARRHRIKDQSNPVQEVRERFEKKPKQETAREFLMRLEINPETGRLVQSWPQPSLHDDIMSHPVLSGFYGVASKENGIDIEGIASDGQRLYIGFRGPVLRYGMTPVLVFDADDHRQAGQVRYVALQGLGIRDMARVDGGFLIIAGPAGDLPRNFRLFHWDGNDCLPGQRSAGDAPQGRVTLLGTIPAPPGAAPEGLAVLGASTDSYDLLIVYDGPPGGQPTRVRAARP